MFQGLQEFNTIDIKYPEDGSGPLKLVYASPSFIEQKPGVMIGVFVYEINKNYNSSQTLSDLNFFE